MDDLTGYFYGFIVAILISGIKPYTEFLMILSIFIIRSRILFVYIYFCIILF